MTKKRNLPSEEAFVLDTSAILALRGDEAGADRVQELIVSAQKGRCRLLVSFMSRMELFYLIWREEGEGAAGESIRLLESFPLDWISCEPTILEAAARLKVEGNLSLADSWIGATAIVREAKLVHKDPEFVPLTHIPQEHLPT